MTQTSNIISIVPSLVASLVIGFATLWILEALPLKYALAFTLSILVFTLMSLYAKHNKTFSFVLNRTDITIKIWWLSWFSAIILVVLIKPLNTSSQFLAWNEIPTIIWLRLIASFSLTTIYPGYALVYILARRRVRFLEKSILSILLSISISSIIGFIGILISHSIGTTSFLILLSMNILLFILTSYLVRRNLFGRASTSHIIIIKLEHITRNLLLFALIVFVLLSVYSVNFPDKLVPTIDTWYHYGEILKVLNGTLFSFMPNFYWFYMYVGLFIYVTGPPFINMYMILFVLCLLPILSFYLMCSKFLDKNGVLVATTIYATFSGFGGIYANYIRLTTGEDIIWASSFAASKTFDISIGAVSFRFYLVPMLIGLSALFTLFWLTYDRNLPKLPRIILISAIFTLGYLTHVAEMIIFLIVYTLLLIFSKKDIMDPKSISYGLTLGLIMIIMVDFIAPQKKYGFYYLLKGYFSIVPAGVLGMVAFLYIILYLRLNLFSSIGGLIIKAARKLSLPVVVTFIYLSTLSIIVWTFLLPTFSIDYTGNTFVWYLYAVRLGTPLFMAILGTYQLLKVGEFKIIKLSLVIILISIVLERLMSYLIIENMTTFIFFPPGRMVDFTWIGVALLSTPILIDILKWCANTDVNKRQLIRISKKSAITILLIGIILSSYSSTLYNVEIRSMPFLTLTDSELKALDYLQNETPKNVTVLALGYSPNKINDFGGRFPVEYYQPAIFGADSFEAFLDILINNPYNLYAHFPIKYVWLTNSNISELKKYEKGFFVRHLLNYLPIIYKNDEVTIFEIPSFSPPLEHSDLVVNIDPLATSDQEIVLEMLSLANLGYSIKLNFEPSTAANTIILPNDPNLGIQSTLPYTMSEKSVSQKIMIVFNSLGAKAKPNFNGKGPTVYETFSKTFLRTSYQYISPENIAFYVDLRGATKYNITGYPPAWRFTNITSTKGLVKPSITDVNTFIYLSGTIPDKTYRVYWTMNMANQVSILPANITILNNFEEDGDEDKVVYSGNLSKKLSIGDSYSLFEEDADYLGVALYGTGYINGEAFNYNYWKYQWIKGNKLNIISKGNCYIDNVAKVKIDLTFENRVLDGIENPFLSKFEEPFGAFATFFALDFSPVKQANVVNGVVGPGGEAIFPPIEVPLTYSHDTNVMPIAFYTKDGKPVSPYAFLKKIGDYEIIYIQVYPYFDALQRRAGTDEGRRMFTKLSDLIRILGLPLPKYKSSPEPKGRAILYGQVYLEGNIMIQTKSLYIPEIDRESFIGWKEDVFQNNWSVLINKPENGRITVSYGENLTIAFNASIKNVWQYFSLNIPNIEVSKYRYLILKEMINADNYNLGYIRIMIGGYVYVVRGWTNETKPPGHPWRTYIFDLYDVIPEKSEAPTPPKGHITKIYWTGYSTGENGGTAKLYLDYIMLTNSPITPTNYRNITASLDLSESNLVFINGIPTTEKAFANVKIFDMQISGDFNSTFTSTEARLTLPGLGRYSKITFSKECNLTLWLTNNSQISFTILANEEPINVTIKGGKIHINLTPLKEELVVYMSDARVLANGYTKFEKAFISWPYVTIYNPGLPMEIYGPVTFYVNIMDKEFILISELDIKGKYKVLSQQLVQLNEWNIPWLAVLNSPYHLLLVSVIIAIVAVNEIKKQYQFKIKLKLRYS